ncbi:glycine cleavage system protein GcvH [Streptomyces sp. NPDC006193]|uniref:glycine cleavage system protein GcvH n=1 Tax=Streptomyces sp. NPDC006193 TaxID=3155717 RepID=UPI0033B01CC6
MSSIPADLRYTETHEWVRLEADGTVTIGLSDHAQQSFDTMLLVDVREALNKTVEAGDPVGFVESVRTATKIYAPIGGEVIAVNGEMVDSPELINEEPYKAWILKLKPSNRAELDDLLDAAGYKEAIGV